MRRGMDKQQWYKFLQTYCLMTECSFREVRLPSCMRSASSS